MAERWIINRIGLINFWYYDEEEFQLADGKLLLRGANGSGKSVTMQSFIPLLLDGNKSPERLDPFGSRDRRLGNYLLAEDQDDEERTAYLYMEFVKKESGKYLTIGLGLQARKGKPLNSWGFALTDGRRIGQDFFLYKDLGQKLPLSKRELKNRLGDGGEFHESQRDYMQMVNKLLYGFESLEEYDELIKLLIQLRTPKLSKEFKPTVIYDILNNALQPLSDEDLRPMSEAIENMDNIKTQLETLKEGKAAAERIKKEYDRYNAFMLLEKADNFLKAVKQLKNTERVLQEEKRKLEAYQQAYQDAQEKLEELRIAQTRLEHRQEKLQKHDAYQAQKEIEKRRDELQKLEVSKGKKAENLERKKQRERELGYQLQDFQGNYDSQLKKMETLLEEMAWKAEEFKFDEHAFTQGELEEDPAREYDFSNLKNELHRYQEKIRQGKEKLEEEHKWRLEYDRASQELAEAQEEKQEAIRKLEKVQDLFVETKEEFLEKVYSWEKSNSLLKLSQENLVNLSRLVQAYGKNIAFDDLMAAVRKVFNAIDADLRKNLLWLKSKQETLQQELEEKKAELEKWRREKEPEPEREPKVIRNRERLKKAGIPFLPFYQGVDFCDQLHSEARGRLEEALLDMGLLDALIVPEEYREEVLKMDPGMGDKYIFAEPQLLTHELSYLLKPELLEDSGITTVEIHRALKSVVLNQEDSLTYVNETGEYGIGVLKGKAGGNYEARYIGSQARRRYREKLMAEIQGEIDSIREELSQKEKEIKQVQEKLFRLEQELNNFPPKDDLVTAFKLVQEAEISLENKGKIVEKKEEALEKVYSILKKVAAEVREVTARIYLPLNLASYQQASEDAAAYGRMLSELEVLHQKLLQSRLQIRSAREQLEEVKADLDDLLYDLNIISRQIKEHQVVIQNYQDLLATTDYQEVQREIKECIQALKIIPQQIEEEIKKLERYQQRQEISVERLEKLTEEMARAKAEYVVYKEGFEQEYKLGYVLKLSAEESTTAIARKVSQKLKSLSQGNRLSQDYFTALMAKYQENRQFLVEYNLTADYIFVDNENLEEGDENIAEIRKSFKRVELSARIQGRTVNFYALVDFIQDAIANSERLLQESDRQLFEDILANTISKKIRAKIYHAEQWVKKMNNLMESMDTSSGLTLSLRWKSKVAETEEQLDTQQLVELLKSEASLLREEDFKRLSNHFRSKINEARKVMEDKGTTQTFHAIMKDILDYRKWFEFRLYYKKTNEVKKELTNNAFNKFSGGEKAMAMYVPLFSAVYARYENGRPDCPRIISLDEAFAGVDSNNIRDMFRLLEELGLNFIINSQVLWGDYDTVSSLAICELVRPNNAKVVTVIRYQWDGRVRSLLS